MTTTSLNNFLQYVSDLVEAWIKPLVQFFIGLRVQVAIVLAVWLVFTQVEQAIEVYRSIALGQNINQAIVTILAVAGLMIFIWYTSRFFVLEQRGKTENKFQQTLAEWGPRFLGIMPMVGLASGIFAAWRQSINEAAKTFLIGWMVVSLCVGIVILLLFIYRTTLFSQYFLKFLSAKSPGKGLFSPEFEIGFVNSAYIVFNAFSLPLIAATGPTKLSLGVILVLALAPLLNLLLYSWYTEQDPAAVDSFSGTLRNWCIVSLCLSIAFVFGLPPTTIPSLIGSLGVVAIASTILVVVFSAIYSWSLQKKIPALAILIGFVIISSIFNVNDNHRFRQIKHAQLPPLPTLEASFNEWLANRPDRAQYEGKPYPVYLVSAQGGGIFAAYHTATALAKLTESIPSFPQHIFAISSVSGGSLGAAVFASLVKENGGDYRALSASVSQLFEQDLLAPLLTLGLFPDLIQRFIPLPINDWDRANGLEIAFEHAWNRLPNHDRGNPLQRSFYAHWQPQGIAPALVLNTTIVESGKRLAISPFQIVLPTQENIALDEPNVDLRLSTAAGLSARFPFVTPVGWYQRSRDGSKLRLADGGYFDNSGIPTAIDMGRALEQIEGYGKRFKVIYLALVDQPTPDPVKPLKSAGLNELLSPIRVLFSAREARSLSAIELSTYTLNNRITDPFKLNFRTLMLQKVSPEMQIKLPLGWQLATTSKEFIEQQTPTPGQCQVESFKQAFSRHTTGENVKNQNSCVAKSIQTDLALVSEATIK